MPGCLAHDDIAAACVTYVIASGPPGRADQAGTSVVDMADRSDSADPLRRADTPDPGTDTFDVIVIGGGPPGENVAQYAIRGSERTAVIVEHELVGGECSYWACMPSKALLRPGEVLATARHLPGVQSLVEDRSLDVAAVLGRRDGFNSGLDDSSQVSWATGLGIDVVRGTGRLAGVKTVEVTGPDGSVRTLHARHAVVLGTGTTATVPPIPGLAQARPWTSRDATNLHEVPRRVVLVGGGVVACEAANWLNTLGVAELTVIGSAPELLARNEPFAGALVREALTRRGVTVLVDANVAKVTREDPADTGYGHVHGGEVTVTYSVEGGPTGTVTADEIVIATGRTPASADLGLDSVGIATRVHDNHGYVEVDDHLSVAGVDGDWLYAIGDVNGRALLTHMGKYQARLAGAVIGARAEGKPVGDTRFTDRADHDQVPQVTFTDPQVGSVGVSQQQAEQAGRRVRAVEYDMAALAGTSLLRDDYVGRAKLVVDADREVLLGATFVGPDIADLVHAATVAVVGEVPMDRLWHAVPSYPTPSEIWVRLLEAYYFPAG